MFSIESVCLCDLMDCSSLGSSVREIFQARILEWVAISFSGDLPNPGIKPGSLALLADSFPLYHLGNRNETSGFERGCIGHGTPAQS